MTPDKTPDSLPPNMPAFLRSDDDGCALIVEGKSTTRGQLRAAALDAAAFLDTKGMTHGDCLAVWLPNGIAWMQLLFAAAQIGVLVVPISTRYKASEVKHLLEVSRARAIVAADVFLDIRYADIARSLLGEVKTLEQVFEHTNQAEFLPWRASAADQQTNPKDRLPDKTDVLDERELPDKTKVPDDLLCCFSTSGTTGYPKLATHAHLSIVRHANMVARAFDIRNDDVMLCALPLFGVFGFMAALAALAAGASCVLMPVYETKLAVQLISLYRVTHAVGGDSMFDAMLGVENADFSSFRRGAMADFVGLPYSVATRGDAFGIKFTGTYGSSEVYSLMSIQNWDSSCEQRARAGGVPVDPLIEFRLIDPESGSPAAADQPGEIQIRGPNVLPGYLNNPQATTKAFTADGWYRSGDLGIRDSTGFRYLARMGDSLRLRGYLVNPAEIEQVLMGCAGVSGAQVVGVNRPGIGDLAVAYVIGDGTDGSPPGEAEMMAHCREHLANYKVPQRIVVIEAFPAISGPNGTKIQKRELREMAKTLLG